MSGGSLDYAYQQINDLAERIERGAETPLHTAFADHLRLVAKAAHDIEWVWSADYGPDRENEAILAVVSKGAVLDSVVKRAEETMKTLKSAIDLVKNA